ncbi:hypothetical protein BH09PLA1_BH09PLA1_14300 [soil metagenome]
MAIAVTLIGVSAVYWPPTMTAGRVLAGSDFGQLHQRRMAFARDALLGPSHSLPAWYPRELLGTPFWANVQNFPFLPTRLLILLAFDPFGAAAYPAAILLAANLSALFAFLFMRRVGIGLFGSACGAWTFACSGYFASRILPGHLPLLEVYCVLPMLLWLVESLHQARQNRAPAGRWIIALGLASGCAMLAGHPQLSVYSIVAAIAYALWRSIVTAPPRRISAALIPMLTIALGVATASFVLVPMTLLIGRSTRVLELARPTNDIAFEFSMMPTWWNPWHFGKPEWLADSTSAPYRLSDPAYFWDAVAYIGWGPWAALLALLAIAIVTRRTPGSVAKFMLLIGVAAFILALPFWRSLRDALPGVFFRSPARVIYLTEFALAIGLAAGVDAMVRVSRGRRLVLALIGAGVAAHVLDLSKFDRNFLLARAEHPPVPPGQWEELAKSVGGGRVGFDRAIAIRENRSIDDVGFFDSIMLARTYRFIVELSGAKADANVQSVSGAELGVRALQGAGVKYLITTHTRSRLTPAGHMGIYNLYEVPSPDARARFFDDGSISFRTVPDIHAALRTGEAGPSRLMIPIESKPAQVSWREPSTTATVTYRRLDSATIECSVTAPQSGYLRVIESFDPGWSAKVDDQPATIVPAQDALLAVRLEPGEHIVRFRYRTPGARTGLILSLISLAMLTILALCSGEFVRPDAVTSAHS